MKNYSISDLSVGQREEFKYTVTEQKMDLFCKLTGDVNPLHTDADFARASSMAIPAPTTDYIRYIKSAELLDGLYYNRLEDWASATGGHTWGLSSSGFSTELMIPEEIFYNSATRTIRFYFAVDWSTCRTNNSSAPTYTITSNNSSTAIYRFGSSKWAFYSNSFLREHIISKQNTFLIDINISKS